MRARVARRIRGCMHAAGVHSVTVQAETTEEAGEQVLPPDGKMQCLEVANTCKAACCVEC
eukprot:48857-Eustigmatos_ZCMA.PRE.1